MRLNYRILGTVWVVLLAFSLILLRLTNITVTEQRVFSSDKNISFTGQKFLSDGYLMNGWEGQTFYTYTAVINNGIFPPTRLHLYPDNCLTELHVGNYQFEISHAGACDREEGIAIDTELLQKKSNILTATILDNGGRTGLFIHAESFVRTAAKTMLILLFIAAVAAVFVSLSAPKRIVFLVALGLLLRFVYLDHTPYFVRTYDVDGHIDYIEYITGNKSLPPIVGGWEYYQPPMYYLTAGAVYGLTGILGVTNQYTALQLLSLVFFTVFLVYSYRILALDRHLGKKILLYPFALLLFWPTAIIHSVRIGNDVMLYAVYAVSLYYLIRFLKKQKSLDAVIAILAAGFSVIVKSNGIALVVVVLACMMTPQGLVWIRGRKKLFLLSLGFVAAFFMVNAVRLAQYPARVDPFIANISTLNSGLRVKTTVSNMLSFDVYNFITKPFASGWDDATGRQQFFTFLWKTSLFNENFDGQMVKLGAQIIMVLFLGLSIYAIAGVILMVRNKKTAEIRPLVLGMSAGILLFFSFFARVRYPYAPTGDFRYIFPFLISYAYFFGYSLNYLEGKGWKYTLFPKALVLLFGIISAVICLFLP